MNNSDINNFISKQLFHDKGLGCFFLVLAIFIGNKSVYAQNDRLADWQSDYLSGYINKSGKVVIPTNRNYYYYSFSDGLAMVRNIEKKYGFIDKTGELVIPCKWPDAYPFSEGLANVKNDEGKSGFIDKAGDLVIPFKWDYVGFFHDGLCLVEDNGKYGFIDKTGMLVIPCVWDYASNFSEGLSSVLKGKGYGYIDKSGNLVIPCKWKDAYSFSEGLAWVMDKNDNFSCINKKGEIVFTHEWVDYPSNFSDGYASVSDQNGRSGFIDKTGRLRISCKWLYTGDFHDGMALVRNPKTPNSDGGHGYIDKTGKLVVPYKWKSSEDFSEGLAYVSDGSGESGYIDKFGKLVIPCKDGYKFTEGLSYVRLIKKTVAQDNIGDSKGTPSLSSNMLDSSSANNRSSFSVSSSASSSKNATGGKSNESGSQEQLVASNPNFTDTKSLSLKGNVSGFFISADDGESFISFPNDSYFCPLGTRSTFFKTSGELSSADFLTDFKIFRDEKGRLSSLIYFNGDLAISMVFGYDANSTLISTYKTFNHGLVRVMTEIENYTYNQQGNIISCKRITTLDDDCNIERIKTFTISYTKFDARGNWTERFVTTDGKKSKQTQIIDYFK